MSADFYGSTAGVRVRTGVEHTDLGLDADGDLDATIEGLLTEAADLMDRQMRKSYLADEIPPGLDGIANDVVSDSIRSMVQSRQTPVVRIDDFAVMTVKTVVLSDDVCKRLKLYAAGRGVVSVDLDQDAISDIGIGTVLLSTDLDAVDADAP